MQELELIKPDGRRLALYSTQRIAHVSPPRSPHLEPLQPNPHLRWHPLRGEWVTYAAYRQGRTFLPPPEYNPLRPSDDAATPTELPIGDYEIAVFDNLYPALAPQAHDPPASIVPTAPADGRCEVVVFTQDPATPLGQLPLSRIELLLEVWGRRTQRLAEDPRIRYVLPFENRGVEVGVTLHHPHGQLYAYPFVPPVPARMLQNEREHYERERAPLLETLIRAESQVGERMIYAGEHAVAFVPAWARYPYEVWVAPRYATPDFRSLDAAQRADLARALKATLLRYDGLWRQPFPYVMAWYQAPVNDGPAPWAHLHAELWPPYRARGKLKYLAGTELAAGTFASDALPEDKARELRDVEIVLDEPPT